MKKSLIIVIVLAALIVLGILLFGSRAPQPSTEDSTATIFQELETVNLGDLDKEFSDIDGDLQKL